MEEKKYPAASLETAACLWEEVLVMLDSPEEPRSAAKEAKERLGMSHLRLTVIGWTDAADEDWAKVKTDLWHKPFDWEWIPAWIESNVDWSIYEPTLRSPRVIPGMSS